MLSAQMSDRPTPTEPRDEDAWARARAAQRDDVAGIFAPRERHCPECGATQQGSGRRCEACGAELVAHIERGRSRRPLLFAVIVAVVLAAIAVPIIAGMRDDAAEQRDREAAEQAQRIERERVRQVRNARPVRAAGPALPAGADPIAHRADLLADAEAKITADARERLQDGRLDGGDVQGTECAVYPATDERRAAETDPGTRAARYDCVAYTSKLESAQGRTAAFGHPYWLVIDFADSRYVWCQVTPRAGEGGSVLVSVPVPVPCRDPDGPEGPG
jgi:type II secretory pathway pseudopilin PulG